MYIWIKALHVISMVTWFAGLFYLPRLFVYHAQTTDTVSLQRFGVMERRLFSIMTIGCVLTVVFGAWMLTLQPGWRNAGWFQTKMIFVAALLAYHVWCWFLHRSLVERRSQRSARWFKMFNEAPSLALLAIVILAVVKPF